MKTTTPPHAKPVAWLVAILALLYCLWLGAHWLPLDYSDKELAASASRVWDLQQELSQHGSLPWWTPNFMSGSSYGLNYARGFHLLPWLLLAQCLSLPVAGKVMALGAIFAGAVLMYFCARYLLKNAWAAFLSAMVFLLHPEQLTRAATQEHIPIITFIPFIPLVWWLFARTLDRQRWRDVVLCAVVVVFAMWADVKQLVVQAVFLAAYFLFWCYQNRPKIASGLAVSVKVTALSLLLGAFIIVPGLTEQAHVKMFQGDPLEAWQRSYGLHSTLALVDRDGAMTRASLDGVRQAIQSGAIRVSSQQEAQQMQGRIEELMGLQMDSPEKYAGLVLLGLILLATLGNARRQNRPLFWFALGMLLLAVMLGSGLRSVWEASATVFGALWSMTGVPSAVRGAVLLVVAVFVAAITFLVRRKLTKPWQWWALAGVLVLFLFVPGFRLLAVLPYFKEIRAPGVFYTLPFAFFAALLAGFVITDVLDTERRRRFVPILLTGATLLLLLDYWPYQASMKNSGVPGRTLTNLRETYSGLAKDGEAVKTYSVSGRYFHLLGPIYSGKPQVYEAFYNWMAPLGTGLLNQHAFSSWDNHRAFLNLMGARYIVYDKTDPGNQRNQQLSTLYRQTYPVASENEDLAVFRNDNARPYVTAYARACLFTGELRDSPPLTLALAAKDWPLVQATATTTGQFERVYKTAVGSIAPSSPAVRVPLTDLQIKRERHGLIRIHATAPTACTLVIAESYYPFWTAQIDGAPTQLLRVSTALMGVELPAGRHELVLRYQPSGSYKLAAGVTGLALLLCLGLAIWDWRRR